MRVWVSQGRSTMSPPHPSTFVSGCWPTLTSTAQTVRLRVSLRSVDLLAPEKGPECPGDTVRGTLKRGARLHGGSRRAGLIREEIRGACHGLDAPGSNLCRWSTLAITTADSTRRYHALVELTALLTKPQDTRPIRRPADRTCCEIPPRACGGRRRHTDGGGLRSR